MKKHGYALIFTLIIMIPIIVFVISILDSVTTDYKVVYNSINSQQSYYNAEAGMLYAKNKLIAYNYKTKKEVYYLHIKDGDIQYSSSNQNRDNSVYVEVYKNILGNKSNFRIICKSDYFGFKQELEQNVVRQN